MVGGKGLASRPETWKEHRWKTGDEVGLRETLVHLVDGHVEDGCGPCQYPRGRGRGVSILRGPRVAHLPGTSQMAHWSHVKEATF